MEKILQITNSKTLKTYAEKHANISTINTRSHIFEHRLSEKLRERSRSEKDEGGNRSTHVVLSPAIGSAIDLCALPDATRSLEGSRYCTVEPAEMKDFSQDNTA